MRKVFLMAALVLASTSGSNVCAMNEAVQEASLSELMPVKKTTKKTSKKTSKKKTTTSCTYRSNRNMLARCHRLSLVGTAQLLQLILLIREIQTGIEGEVLCLDDVTTNSLFHNI